MARMLQTSPRFPTVHTSNSLFPSHSGQYFNSGWVQRRLTDGRGPIATLMGRNHSASSMNHTMRVISRFQLGISTTENSEPGRTSSLDCMADRVRRTITYRRSSMSSIVIGHYSCTINTAVGGLIPHPTRYMITLRWKGTEIVSTRSEKLSVSRSSISMDNPGVAGWPWIRYYPIPTE